MKINRKSLVGLLGLSLIGGAVSQTNDYTNSVIDSLGTNNAITNTLAVSEMTEADEPYMEEGLTNTYLAVRYNLIIERSPFGGKALTEEGKNMQLNGVTQNYRLTAILETEDGEISASLEDLATGKAFNLKRGEYANGFELESVDLETKRAYYTYNDELVEYVLTKKADIQTQQRQQVPSINFTQNQTGNRNSFPMGVEIGNAPTQPNAYQTPTQPNAYQTPTQPNAYQTPTQPNAYQTPTQPFQTTFPGQTEQNNQIPSEFMQDFYRVNEQGLVDIYLN